MSELISGKEAWIAKSDHKNVEWKLNGISWSELTDSEFMSWDTSRFLSDTRYQFRLKPRTIMIGGVEVPAPFEPKEGDIYWFPDVDASKSYSSDIWGHDGSEDNMWSVFGAWRTEVEIKQVVAALRKLFKRDWNEKNAD